jgi:hypothetical protein
LDDTPEESWWKRIGIWPKIAGGAAVGLCGFCCMSVMFAALLGGTGGTAARREAPAVDSPLAKDIVGNWAVSNPSQPGLIQFTPGGTAIYTFLRQDDEGAEATEHNLTTKYVFIKENVVEFRAHFIQTSFEIDKVSKDEMVFRRLDGFDLRDIEGKLTRTNETKLKSVAIRPATNKPANGGGDGSGDGITEDYMPHKPGAVATYLIDMPGVGIAKHRLTYKADGAIDKTIVSIGERFVNQHIFGERRVVANGMVGHAGKDGQWYECLKIGATKGDKWEKDGVKYVVKSFGTYSMKYDNKSRPTVSVWSDIGGAVQTTAVYVKGIGLLKKDGTSPAGKVHWQVEELEKRMNLTKAERAFFE